MKNKKSKSNINIEELEKISGGISANEALKDKKFSIALEQDIQPLIRVRPMKNQGENYKYISDADPSI